MPNDKQTKPTCMYLKTTCENSRGNVIMGNKIQKCIYYHSIYTLIPHNCICNDKMSWIWMRGNKIGHMLIAVEIEVHYPPFSTFANV